MMKHRNPVTFLVVHAAKCLAAYGALWGFHAALEHVTVFPDSVQKAVGLTQTAAAWLIGTGLLLDAILAIFPNMKTLFGKKEHLITIFGGSERIQAPRLARFLLNLLLPETYHDDALATFDEVFLKKYAQFGKRLALIWCWLQVLTSIMPVVAHGMRQIAKRLGLARKISQ